MADDMYVGVVHGFFSVELQPSEREFGQHEDWTDPRREAEWRADDDVYGDLNYERYYAVGMGAQMINDRVTT